MIKELTAIEKRKLAYKNSSLPYCFEYKIRNAFFGKYCPICGCKMTHNNNLVKPTIQHNIPITLGGKHEIDNISVICKSCNASIRNSAITKKLNNDLVKEIWNNLRYDERNGKLLEKKNHNL